MSTSAVARIEQPAQIVDLISSWPGCNPNVMVTILKSLNPTTDPGCLGLNTKVFFTSYPAFSSMSVEQKNKTMAFFNKLLAVKRQSLITICQHESAKTVADER
jgi:hypothetical protein